MTLYQVLERVGLQERWVNIINEHLGVFTMKGMAYVGSESYPTLVHFINKPQEKEALRKLLKMENVQNEKLSHNKRFVMVKSELVKTLQQLKEFRDSGMNRLNEKVVEIENQARELVQVPQCFWFNADLALSNILENMSKMIQSLDIVSEGEDFNELAFIQQVSGCFSFDTISTALKGILVMDGKCEPCSGDIIKVPSGIKFSLPLRPQYSEVLHFYSENEEGTFFDHILLNGDTNTIVSSATSETYYISTVKYCYMPMASCYFEKQQISLTDSALSSLLRIDKLITEESTEKDIGKACEEFLKQFGSHCFLGNLHFGGIYICKCYTKGNKSIAAEKLKTFHRQVIDAQVSMCIPQCYEETCVADLNIPNVEDASLKVCTHIKVFTIGGHDRAVGFPDWKVSLSGSNKTWKMIDCGSVKLPVWEIILKNHRPHYRNAEYLASTLKKYWIDHISSEKCSEDLDLSFKKYVVTLQNDVLKVEEQLQALYKMRQEFEQKSCDPQKWAIHYIPHLKYYVSLCIKQSDINNIKHLLINIIDPIDIRSITDPDFKRMILKEVYGTENELSLLTCVDFMKFERYLKQVLDTTQSLNPSCWYNMITMVECGADLFCSHLSQTLQIYEECLLLTMIHCFNYNQKEGRFHDIVTRRDIEILNDKFKLWLHNFFTIPQESELKRQSYLFYLMVEVGHTFQAKEEAFETHVLLLKERFTIHPEIRHFLEKIIEWNQFKLKMETLFRRSGIEAEKKPSKTQILQTSPKPKSASSTAIRTKNPKKKRAPVKPATTKHNKQLKASIAKLLDQLGLRKYLSNRLSIPDAITIRKDTMSEMNKYPFIVLQKIMAFDSKCRMKFGVASTKSDDSDSDSDSDEGSIHPMDGLLALILCSDNFLRQDIFCRLSTCQIAVPLLFPEPTPGDPMLMMWAMRSIIKEYKMPEGKTCSTRIISHPTPFVCFMRVGTHSISKSEIINGVMNEADSDIKRSSFMGFNSPGGTNQKVMISGLVEVSWYLPGDGVFPTPIAFTNLRGDAIDPELNKQIDFILHISTISVVLLSFEAITEDGTKNSTKQLLKKLAEAPGGLIILQSKTNKALKLELVNCLGEHLFKSKLSVITSENKSASVFLKKVQSKLRSRLGITDCFTSLESASGTFDIKIDEDELDCKKAKRLMEIFYGLIEKRNIQESPRDLLPLQSHKFWHSWAALEKEQFRQKKKHQHETRINSGQGTKEWTTWQYSEEQRKQMREIRHLQYPIATQAESVIHSFIATLKIETGNVLHYFLMWLKFTLDNISRNVLPPLYTEIGIKLTELNDIPKHYHTTVKRCKEELKALDTKLLNSSFGLEHIFREIGQVYEAISEHTEEDQSIIQDLPMITAQLFHDGFPLELLDGDASHIPKKWISSVLRCLAKILKNKHGFDPNVYIISVLGVQSTGKSTLLNTVFGVQFSVSAGRCTRGAFMQLIPVHPSLHEEIGAHYFLLIDTEGLRAPELDRLEGREHDNELATFVIGMANLTLINVAGEVAGDMDDILHTVVHAFLRMNQVQLQPSCYIIHQHVVAVNAQEKMMQGSLKTKDKLDEMTKAAAKETGNETQYTHFTDVIKFNHQKDVSYFPDLWIGTPPMAHVNTGYSELAQRLKQNVIQSCGAVCKHSVHDIIKHLENLWKAILHEDFVFTFQNTFEIVAFKNLEGRYGDWSWGFKCNMNQWERTAEKTIYTCQQDKLDVTYARLFQSLQEVVNTKYMFYSKMAVNFFKERNNQITLKWKPDIQSRLQLLRKQLERHAEDHILQVYQAKNSRAQADREMVELNTEILGYIQQLISTIGDSKCEDSNLERLFEEQWIIWMHKLTAKVRPLQPQIDVEQQVEICVTNAIESKRKFYVEKFSDEQTSRPLRRFGSNLALPISEHHIKAVKVHLLKVFYYTPYSSPYFKIAQQHTDTTLSAVEARLKILRQSDQNFSQQLVTDLLHLIEQKKPTNLEGFQFTEEYDVDMALTACAYAIPVFEEMAETFRKKHDPILYIEYEMKPQFRSIFLKMYAKMDKENIFADTLCTQLNDPIKEFVLEHVPILIVEDMRGRHPYIKVKQRFIANILLDIGEMLNNSEEKQLGINYCTHFLNDARSSIEVWSKTFLERHCDSGALSCIAKSVLTTKIGELIKEVENITSSDAPPSSMREWMKKFYSQAIEGKLNAPLQSIYIESQEFADVNIFTKEVTKRLKELGDKLEEFFAKMKYRQLAEKANVHELIFENVAGCTKQCPFCKAQCELTIENHTPTAKHATQHRPRCLGGRKWEEDNTMVLDICSFSVSSDSKTCFKTEESNGKLYPYNKYSKLYPDWCIPADKSLESSLYWKWFIGKYSNEIANFFGHSLTEIPAEWKELKWGKVKDWLKNEYHL